MHRTPTSSQKFLFFVFVFDCRHSESFSGVASEVMTIVQINDVGYRYDFLGLLVFHGAGVRAGWTSFVSFQLARVIFF
jgi:hypothetical protein